MENDRDEFFAEVLQDVIRADIAFRVNASIALHKLRMMVSGSSSPEWDVAMDAVIRHRNTIIETLVALVFRGRFGRNQEEEASQAVLNLMESRGELIGYNDQYERLEDVLEAIIQPMRYYFVNDAYVRNLREQLDGCDMGVPDVSKVDGRS